MELHWAFPPAIQAYSASKFLNLLNPVITVLSYDVLNKPVSNDLHCMLKIGTRYTNLLFPHIQTLNTVFLFCEKLPCKRGKIKSKVK